jgi:hypothetical protein
VSGPRTAPGYFTGVHSSSAMESIARWTSGFLISTNENSALAFAQARTTALLP